MNNNNQDNLRHKSHSVQDFSKEQEHYLHLTHSVFSSEKGKQWVEFMRDSFLEKLPVADPSKDLNHAFYREGQNSIIRSIFQNIKVYEDVIKNNNQSGD